LDVSLRRSYRCVVVTLPRTFPFLLTWRREVQRISSLPHHLVAAPVVALGRRHTGITGHALHGAYIVAGAVDLITSQGLLRI